MELLAANVTQAMADLLLPFMRVSGLFAAMVGVSAKSVPPQVRALLTLFLSVLIMPVVPAVRGVPGVPCALTVLAVPAAPAVPAVPARPAV